MKRLALNWINNRTNQGGCGEPLTPLTALAWFEELRHSPDYTYWLTDETGLPFKQATLASIREKVAKVKGGL